MVVHDSQCRTERALPCGHYLGGVASSVDTSIYSIRAAARASAARISVHVSPKFQRPERSRSGACARPLSLSRSGSRLSSVDGCKQSGAKCSELKARSHARLRWQSCARQSAVFGVAVMSEAQARKDEHRSRSELTRQSPQSVAPRQRQSRSAPQYPRVWCRTKETKHSRADRTSVWLLAQ